MLFHQPGDHGALADRRGPGNHEHAAGTPVARTAARPAPALTRIRPSGRRSDADPDPARAGSQAISSRSMISAARFSPTRASALRRSTTLTWASTSSLAAVSSASERDSLPVRSCSLSAARARRAAVAASRAACSCSGDKVARHERPLLGDCKVSGNSVRAKREHLLYHGLCSADFPLNRSPAVWRCRLASRAIATHARTRASSAICPPARMPSARPSLRPGKAKIMSPRVDAPKSPASPRVHCVAGDGWRCPNLAIHDLYARPADDLELAGQRAQSLCRRRPVEAPVRLHRGWRFRACKQAGCGQQAPSQR